MKNSFHSAQSLKESDSHFGFPCVDTARGRRALSRVSFLLFLLFSFPSSRAQSPPQAAALSFEKKCYSCHNIGGGDKKGPDLKGVTDRRTQQWLHEYIETPSALNRNGDPAAVQLFKKYAPEVMPDQTLSSEEIDSLLMLIETVTRKNEIFIPPGARLSRPVVASDRDGGFLIFTGRVSLKNGGTACISCHNLRAVGRLGGGTLGPDLTAVNIKYRNPELISILQNPNFPTMKSVFGTRPLSDEEIVQLFALFQDSKLKNPTAPVQTAAAAAVEPKFLLLGIAALVVVLVGSNRAWKNRLRGVREELVRRRKP